MDQTASIPDLAQKVALFKQRLRQEGQTQRSWAQQHNVNVRLLQEILRGRIQCNYGESHRIAVIVGWK